jgi:hypothetical protein
MGAWLTASAVPSGGNAWSGWNRKDPVGYKVCA